MQTIARTRNAFSFSELVDAAGALPGAPLGRKNRLNEGVDDFLNQLLADAVADDLAGLSAADFAGLAAQLWMFSQTRRQNEIKLQITPGLGADGGSLGRSILQINAPDRPFMVDTVLGEITAQGADVLALFHPIVTFERDGRGERGKRGTTNTESLIQVHLAPLDPVLSDALKAGVQAALDDLTAAVTDFADMRARMDHVIDELKIARTAASSDEVDEAVAFLRWLRADNFALFGSRAYEFACDEAGEYLRDEPRLLVETGRGVLRDPARNVLRRKDEPAILTDAIADFLKEPAPLLVAKSSMISRVHRRVYMDYVGVKRYRADGAVVGETRFVGLFTAEAYHSPVTAVPLIRRKVRRVLERANLREGSHNYKKFKNIIETYPRDELLQSSEDELLEIALGILHLFDRPRFRIFIRRDRYDRYLSAFVFIPRDRFNSKVRAQMGAALAAAYDGEVRAFYPLFGDGPLARVHFMVGLTPFTHPEPSLADLESALGRYVRTWDDEFDRQARIADDHALLSGLSAFEGAFTAGYREAVEPEDAVEDASIIAALDAAGPGAVHVRVRPGADGEMALTLFRKDGPAPLSDVMPILDRMDLRVLRESGWPVRRRAIAGSDTPPAEVWIHTFVMVAPGFRGDPAVMTRALEQGFEAVWSGAAENDRFNALIPLLGLDWRDVAFLRACARYRVQSGLDPSQGVQEQALAENPTIVNAIIALRDARFDPDFAGDRDAEQARLRTEIAEALDSVASLDSDRVLRRIADVVHATQRTSFYQTTPDGAPKTAIALKLAPREIEELPDPKPFREIFVWSPKVEGVHMRFGPVARGGLRWSDRRDDFRTEVLGLVKAQQVKNAVIVPVGSKGGFFPKLLPRTGDRAATRKAAIEAYTIFIQSMLDVTDNLVDGAVVAPARTVIYDGEDPYLVVAADKGTATFSDIANAIAERSGFWLGDAFASGGSAGYDHKGMGITARGAWVAVQRHFRELGKDIQTEPFTVAGVGDMSGDVFGNGMLLSKQIRLVAAFDHRHIFVDPDPQDPERSWAERQRLFDLPQSSWTDYDASLISQGGGVFSRNDKRVPLSEEIRALTGLDTAEATPNQLLHALLQMDVELLWFGGIGTYIKAADELDYQVGDRANDALRVTAGHVRAKVIGEGANLAVTQAGRVALARAGVKVNADFIDNAAGVDTSDHEVNIKILLNAPLRDGRATLQGRNDLLASMTDAVADSVLRHNYDQTLALSLGASSAAADRDAHERLIERLEARGQLDRELEGLPSAEEFRELRERGAGLTRPEIALLVSYAKINVFDRLLETNLPDDPHFEGMLSAYFPRALRPYTADMKDHRLRREIIATVLANDLVNLGGPTFVHRARESTGGDTDAVARAFEAARAIFDIPALIERVNGLDNVAPAAVQAELYREIVALLRRQTYWLVRRGRSAVAPQPLAVTIGHYKPGVDALRAMAGVAQSPFQKARTEDRVAELVADGAPEDLAQDVVRLRPLVTSTDVIDLAHARRMALEPMAYLYHAVGRDLRFDELRGAAGSLSSPDHWDRLAVRRLIENFYTQQHQLVAILAPLAGKAPKSMDDYAEWSHDAMQDMLSQTEQDTAIIHETIDELRDGGAWTLSKLSIIASAMREYVITQQGDNAR